MTFTPPPWQQQPPPQPYGGPPPYEGQQPYGGPSQPYGGPPPFVAPTPSPYAPPPPPFGAFEQPVGAVPPVAWLIPVAALLAVVGACVPWFRGTATVGGQTTNFKDSLYSWADGRIGLLPPITLVLLSVAIIALLRGRSVRRFSRGSSHPVVSAARTALILGGVSLVCVVIAWFLVPTQYKFDSGYGGEISWNDALDKLHQQGVDASFSRGPQLGYYLTIAAAVLAIVAGVLMLLTRDRTAVAAPTFTPPGWSAPPPPPSPAAGFQQGYAPPPAAAPAPTEGWSTPTTVRPNDPDGTDGRPSLTK